MSISLNDEARAELEFVGRLIEACDRSLAGWAEAEPSQGLQSQPLVDRFEFADGLVAFRSSRSDEERWFQLAREAARGLGSGHRP